MFDFPLECCKLQIGCLVVILYLAFIYSRERRRFQLSGRTTVYDILLWEGIACLLLDAVTAYTVNHQELVGAYVNLENPAMKELSRYHDEMVMGFATLIENRDSNTGGHVKRTTQYVKLLAEEVKRRGFYAETLTKDYLANLLKAAPMHDVGKIAVPDAILQKPGRLTPEEFEQMKLHAAKDGEIIQQSFGRMGNAQYLEIASQIARYHHEKWNGKGYPDGLQRKEIPLCARIMAIADVFDAVSEDRCYRPALPLDECFEIIQEGSGQDFDPILAEVFLELRPEVQRARQESAGNRL